jgi:hypothetical protein
VTGFYHPVRGRRGGWDREEVINALNVALFVGGATTIPHVRGSYARKRGPQTFGSTSAAQTRTRMQAYLNALLKKMSKLYCKIPSPTC